MKQRQVKLLTALLIVTMFMVALAPIALAAGVRSGEIPVAISLTGSPPESDEDYEIIMKADNTAYPMPAGSVDGLFTMKVTGADTSKLPEIEFSSLGIYTYRIFQKAGTNELGVYDESEYNLTVYVTNAEDGSGLETTVLLYLLGEMEKYDEIAFHNHYFEEEFLDIEEPPEDDEELEEEFLDEEDIPEDKLPKTGEIAPMAFYGIGTLLLGMGIILGRRKRK